MGRYGVLTRVTSQKQIFLPLNDLCRIGMSVTAQRLRVLLRVKVYSFEGQEGLACTHEDAVVALIGSR